MSTHPTPCHPVCVASLAAAVGQSSALHAVAALPQLFAKPALASERD